jgi:hypothetical protein
MKTIDNSDCLQSVLIILLCVPLIHFRSGRVWPVSIELRRDSDKMRVLCSVCNRKVPGVGWLKSTRI